MKNILSLRILVTVFSILCLLPNANADFITPTSVTSLNSSPWAQYNNVNALIENANSINYIAPNPSSGGGGTSTYTNQSFNTWTFNLDAAHTLNAAYIWDYYGHSPTGWRLTFFDGVNATGTNLGSHTFDIAPVCSNSCSTRHDISFPDVANARSITLTSTNNSTRGGVGLAEVHFSDTATNNNNQLAVSIKNVSQGYDISPYGGAQDHSGTAEVRNSGASLFLEGNRWQKIDFPYTVTADTVIEFDFESTNRGEIHGLGFDNDLALSANRSFRLYGSQGWGISDFATYSGSGVTHYVIPVGQFYTGAFQYLFFINDDDSNPTGNSLFSNIVVHEGIAKDCTIDTGDTSLIFCEGFEVPNISPPYSQDLPSGWTETGDSGLIDEGSGWLTTPYGEQVLWVNNGSVATSSTNLSAVLTADVTYTLSFNIAKRSDLGGDYKVELLAGSTVLASKTGAAALTDFSESDEIVFVANSGHANLGETLQIQISTNGTLQPQFDNISLRVTGDGRLSVSKEGVGQKYDVSTYGGSGQDRSGIVEVQDIDLSLYLEGNRWQKVDFPYTVTPNTVIEFDFESTNQGEIHGLGFDNNLALSSNRSFKLYGTQNWGLRDFDTYSGSGSTHYTIPVGQYYTGAFQYLFFMNDDDSNPTGNSLYSNINVYESIPDLDGCGTLDAVGIRINNGGSDSRINTTSEALAIHAAWLAASSPESGVISGGTYNVAASGSSKVDHIDFGGSVHDFTATLPYPGAITGVGGSDFLVHTSGTLSLPAGDYTIYVESDDGFSFVMNTVSGDTVSFSKFGGSSSGAGNELRYENPTGNSNTGGSFTLTQDSVFDVAAIFFERGGGDYLEISIANNIRSNAAPSGYEILRHNALGDKVKFGCASPKVHHYQITHDGNGLTCAAEPVTIKACMNSDCSTLSTEEVTLDFQVTNATPTTTTKKNETFTGSTSLNFSHIVPEILSLSINNASVPATDPLVCDDGSGASCDIVFSETGFIFGHDSLNTPIIPTQISGKPSNTGFNSEQLFLQAVKTDDSSSSCVGVFPNGGDIPVNLSYTCHGDSSACSNDLVLIDNANTIPLKQNYVEHNLRFNNDSKAYFSINYPDAGKLIVNAQKDIDVGGLGDVKSFSASTNAFVVRPFGIHLDFSQDTNSATALASDASGSAFKKAGETFSLTATAKQWVNSQDNDNDGIPDNFALLTGNPIAGNFTNEQLKVEHQLFLPDPTTAEAGALTTVASNNFVSSTLKNDYKFDEVGIIHLSASLADGDYIGGGDVKGYIANVGRFTPAAFKLISTNDGSLHVPQSGQGFAYVGQKNGTDGVIKYLLEPAFTIQAINVAGQATKNYTFNDDSDQTKDFMKLTTAQVILASPTTDDADGVLDGTNGVDGTQLDLDATISGTLVGDGGADGKMTFTMNASDHFTYQHIANSQVNQFIADIDLIITSINDGEGVLLPDQNDTIPGVLNLNPTGVPIRFGRWYIDNAYGPETSALPVTMYTQYWNGNSFVTNTLDDFTVPNSTGKIDTGLIWGGGLSDWQYRLLDVSTDSDEPITPNDTSVSVANPLSPFVNGKYENFIFSAPANNSRGSLEFEYEVPAWLKYDWDKDGAYDDNPSAIVTFGLFRGNDRIISWREVSN